MECPRCRYMLSAFDADCPRCKNFGTPRLVSSTLETEQTNGEEVRMPKAEKNFGQSASPTATVEPWYSKLDLEEIQPVSEAPALDNKPEPASSISPITEPALPHPTQVISPTPVRSATTSTIMVPRSVFQEPSVPTPLTLPPRSAGTWGSGKRLIFTIGGLAVLVVLGLLLTRTEAAFRKQYTQANQMLTQAKALIVQATITTTLFRQADLSPEQANESLRSRTLQYDKALQLCQTAYSWV